MAAAIPGIGIAANEMRLGRTIPWSSKAVHLAADALERGATEVTVKGRDEAGELLLRLVYGKGYKNTTGMTGKQVRTQMGSKAGTYHWDTADTVHGGLPHLQIHDDAGNIVRIFY
jgi:hypothetical protein